MLLHCRAWPVCLAGKDVQAVAEPGSGKTLGYLLPAIPMLQQQAALRQSGDAMGYPVMLILAPTRSASALHPCMHTKPRSVLQYGALAAANMVDAATVFVMAHVCSQLCVKITVREDALQHCTAATCFITPWPAICT